MGFVVAVMPVEKVFGAWVVSSVVACQVSPFSRWISSSHFVVEFYVSGGIALTVRLCDLGKYDTCSQARSRVLIGFQFFRSRHLKKVSKFKAI